VAGLLGGLGGDVARETLLKGLETEAHPRVRLALVKSLEKMRHPQVEAILGAIAEGDSSLFAEAEAGAVLGRLQSTLGQSRCEALLKRSSWGEVLAAGGLKGLGASRDPKVLDTLLQHTEAHHPQRVRAAAAGALAALAAECEACVSPALDCLVELTQTAGFRVRLAAVAALGRLRDPRALPTLSALHASTGDGRLRRMAYEAIQDIRDGRTSSQALGALRQTVEELERKQAGLRDRLSSLEGQD
jgi:HEAT repeat protein